MRRAPLPWKVRMIVRSPASMLVVLCSLLAVSTTGSGCDSDLQARLDGKRTERFDKAAAAIRSLEETRYENLTASTPKEGAKEGATEHPLDGWRRQVTARNDGKIIGELSASAPPSDKALELVGEAGKEKFNVGLLGTPALQAADFGSQFLKESNDFWTKTSSSTLSRYADFLKSYLANVETARTKAAADKVAFVEPPFVDEARFDQAFIHVLNFLNLSIAGKRQDLFPSNASDYQVAFGIGIRTATEGFSDYISRLCAMNEGLRERCKGVPHEFRPAVVDRAFLEWLLERTKGFSTTSAKAKVFQDILTSVIPSLEAAINVPLETPEDPELPSVAAPVGGINGVRVTASGKAGIKVHEKQVAVTFAGTFATGLAGDINKVFEEIKATPGGGVDYQRAALSLPGNLGAAEWVKVARSFPAKIVKELSFVGRRRLDESMRITALTMKVPRADDGETASFQFKEDAAKTSCDLIGTLGDAPFGKKKDFYVEVSPGKVRVAELLPAANDGQERVMAETQTFPALGKQAEAGGPGSLGEFLDKNPGIRVRLFVRGFNYGEGLDQVSKVLYTCKDERLSYDQPNREPYVRVCGKGEQRPVAIGLSVCR
jgi:hypothetical protein